LREAVFGCVAREPSTSLRTAPVLSILRKMRNKERLKMTASVTASELQKNFGLWHDKALKEPVQITKHGRETAYLVSAEMFNEMWSCFRRAMHVRDLSESEMAMIEAAEIAPEHAYDIEDISQPDDPSRPSDHRKG
jgi:prevent-host-death family protein